MTRWWRRLLSYAHPHRASLVAIAAVMVAGIGVNALTPWPLKLIVDHVLVGEALPPLVGWMDRLPGAQEPRGLLAWLTVGTLVLFLTGRAVQLIKGYLRTTVGASLSFALGGDVFHRLHLLTPVFYGRRRAGDLVRRVTLDSGCVRDLVLGAVLTLATSFVKLLIMFVIMWQLDPQLALVTLIVALPMGFLVRLLAPRMTGRSYELQEREGEIMSMAEQVLSALPMVQGFGQEAHEELRFRALSQRAIRAYLKSTASQMQFNAGIGGASAIGVAVTTVVGAHHVLDGTLTVGGLLVFLAYLTALYSPMESVAYLAESLSLSSARAKRVLQVLDADEFVASSPANGPIPEQPLIGRGHVRFDNVCFAYEPDRPVLHDITLDVNAGETVALVGTTGAGKSTMVFLIPRLMDAVRGRVMLDGFDVREIELAQLREQISLVLQKPFLLPLTVLENIRYGRPDASREEAVAAAVTANAHDFIQHLPKGYDTILGERAVTLSGGERQRLSIARALLKDAPVLILDEPTSALDAAVEAEVMTAVQRLMAGRTTLIIAHRLSTIRNADRIAVLDHGRIVETGSHRQLAEAHGHYYQFLRAQFGSA